jgi:hypothetical protein
MHNTAIIARLTNVRKHSNADRLQCASVLGNQVVIGLAQSEGELGVYFDSNLQLSEEFAKANDLIRRKDSDGKPAGGMFDTNRKVRTQKFRGEASDGFWIPLNSLDFIKDKPALNEGYEFNEINGIPICNKYIIPGTKTQGLPGAKKTRTAKTSVMFKEHFDTEHFGKHLHEIQFGERIVITEKLHGTSGRVAHVLVEKQLNRFTKFLSRFLPIQTEEWAYLNGTRRVVLEESSGTQFHDPSIREISFLKFKNNLHKGETVYFEIVGYETTGSLIMPAVDLKKMNDKEFLSNWKRGDGTNNMSYTYGCEPGTCEIYVYRITLTDVEGHSVDLSWEDVKTRCSELGVNHVPELTYTTIGEMIWRDKAAGGNGDIRTAQDMVMAEVEYLSKGGSKLDPTHIREGVCVRLDNYGRRPKIYKHKSFEFKVLEGIIKDAGIIDTEEAN